METHTPKTPNTNTLSASAGLLSTVRNGLHFISTAGHGYLLLPHDLVADIVRAEADNNDERMEWEWELESDEGDNSEHEVAEWEARAITDAAGNLWHLMEEDIQYRAWIEAIADHLRIFPHQVFEHVIDHEMSAHFFDAQALIRFIKDSPDPISQILSTNQDS